MIETEGVLSGEMDVRTISQTTVENYFLWLRQRSKQSWAQQKKQWGFLQAAHSFSTGRKERFDRVAAENVRATTFVFKVKVARKIKEILGLRGSQKPLLPATDPDRLQAICLARRLNCGMYDGGYGQPAQIRSRFESKDR